MGVCNCSMFCCMLLYVHSSIAIIMIGKRELVDLLNLSSRCLVMVEWLFLAVPRGCLRFVIMIFPDHTYYFSCSSQLYMEFHTLIKTNWLNINGFSCLQPIINRANKCLDAKCFCNCNINSMMKFIHS